MKRKAEEMAEGEKRVAKIDSIIAEKDMRISKLEGYSRSQNVIISDLNSKIQNFNEYYSTAIYEDRIKSLNEETAKLQKKLNDLTR
jgi:predicted RNase H-like nuclease (RuvC/YqgF family)